MEKGGSFHHEIKLLLLFANFISSKMKTLGKNHSLMDFENEAQQTFISGFIFKFFTIFH